MKYLTLPDLLAIVARLHHTDQPLSLVRDPGLLQSALARPETTVFGTEAYPDLHRKAAALLHSLVSNHGLVDGNKRLGWVAVRLFYRYNDHDLSPSSEDAAFEFVVAIAAGTTADIEKIAEVLRDWSTS